MYIAYINLYPLKCVKQYANKILCITTFCTFFLFVSQQIYQNIEAGKNRESQKLQTKYM